MPYNIVYILIGGGVAQLVEHLLCTQKVAGSIPVTSTILEPRLICTFCIGLVRVFKLEEPSRFIFLVG